MYLVVDIACNILFYRNFAALNMQMNVVAFFFLIEMDFFFHCIKFVSVVHRASSSWSNKGVLMYMTCIHINEIGCF